MLFYSAALALGLLLTSPWWLFRMATTQRYREGLAERLGSIPSRLRSAVQGKRVIWIHAVSVGEVLAASRLVGELQTALGDGFIVVVSTGTRTGQALARERFGAERVFYFPLDFAWSVRVYLRLLQPAVFVLMESELWPRMLHECERSAVPVVVANARVSDRSFARAVRVRGIWKHVLRKVSLWLAQSEEDARRLVTMGANPSAVQPTGNLKYDVRAPRESILAKLIQEAAAGRKVLVGGSTLGEDPSEDSPLIRAFESFPHEHRPLLVLAPRHPENFNAVYAMAAEYPTLRATEMLQGKSSAETPIHEGPVTRPAIILLDTIGDLAAVFGVADLAFVGGSLVKSGGHNPLEPAQFGVPVVMGPSFENFRSIVETMRAGDAISIIGQTPQTLSAAMVLPSERGVRPELSAALVDEVHWLLNHPDVASAIGERGRQVFEQQQGATARAIKAIMQLVPPSGAAV